MNDRLDDEGYNWEHFRMIPSTYFPHYYQTNPTNWWPTSFEEDGIVLDMTGNLDAEL